MNFNFNKQKALKVLFILFFVLLFSYFAWDMSLRIRDSFISQGVSITIDRLITMAEEPQCQPFDVSSGEKRVWLINTRCLEQPQNQPEAIVPEVQE